MKPKKIILVVIDSLRRDHLSCYGYKRDITPNIDSLAKSAVLFKHAFSVCPNTVPSLASILTSKYPGNHSIGFDPEGKLDAQVDRTLASILKENNYGTAAFSGRGGLSGLSCGFDVFDDGEGRRDCAAINNKVFEWLDENYRQDFFLFVHYFDTHGPYLSPEPYKNMFVNDEFYGNPEYIKNISDKEPALNSIPGYQILNSGDNIGNDPAGHVTDLRYYRAQYDACIRSIDAGIGKLQEKLKKLKIYEDSLIIITSDHGEAFGENNVFLEHGLSVTLDQIAVPLIIKPQKGWKLKLGARKIHVSNIDIMHTILTLCDHENEAVGLEGHSLKDIFEDKKDAMLEERTLTAENEYQLALIYSNKLMEIKKKDSPTSKNYPNIPSLVDTLNGKKYYWDSGQEYYLSISFDQYQRYKVISDIINKFRTENKTFKILDVGASFEENLKKFLPFDDIYYLDKDYPPEYKQRTNFIVGDITRLELDETYDFVVSIDTYEHIPVNSREKFINNLLHLSRIATIMAAPFDTPGVKEHEILANEMYKLSHGTEYRWLHEHILNGLPSLPFTIELVKKSGFKYAVIPNGYLPRWHEMISTYLMTEGMLEFSKSLEELNEFYNKNFYCYDNLNPAYRQVIVINKSDVKIDFSDIHSNNFKADKEFSIKYKMLESFIKSIMDFYSNHRYKELKDKELKEKDKELKEKELELKEKDKDLQGKNAQIVDYSQIVTEQNKHVTELTNALNEKNVQITYLSGSLQSMQQSMVWQLTMKFQRLIDYIFPKDTRRGKYYYLGLMYGRIAMKDGFRSSWQKYKDDKKVHTTFFKNNIKIPKLDLKIVNSIEEIETIQKDVSIVIPTKNAGTDFEFTLEKIRAQKGIRDIELIIIDSGSSDETIRIGEKFGSKIYTIKPEDFNHGETRNFGAEKANGDYVLFMVQDAIPIGDRWLYNMAKALESDEKIAAATCRQVPRSDADLFACWAMWFHYKFLDMNTDKILYLNNRVEYDSLSPFEKRKLTQLDDVCACYRKEIFDEFKFKAISFAEDLELGMRLIKTGHKLVFLYSSGVIHSHNRSPSYHIKRSYIDSKTVAVLLDKKEDNEYSSVEKIVTANKILYKAIVRSIKKINEDSINEVNEFASIIKLCINSKAHSPKYEKLDGEKSIDKLFVDIESIFNKNSIHEYNENFNFINLDYLSRLDAFISYPSLTDVSFEHNKEEFIAAIYKLFANMFGESLGKSYTYCNKKKCLDEKMIKIDALLSKEV